MNQSERPRYRPSRPKNQPEASADGPPPLAAEDTPAHRLDARATSSSTVVTAPLLQTAEQSPICRSRAWEDYDRKAIESDRETLAFDLNHDLAKAFSEAIKYVDQGDRDQVDRYLRCHDDLFALLDTIYLLMREMDVSVTEARAIASAVRKHYRRCVDRWRRRKSNC